MIDIYEGPTSNVLKPLIAHEEMAPPANQPLLPDIEIGPPPTFTEEKPKLLFGQKG